jgi:hypothetical protein
MSIWNSVVLLTTPTSGTGSLWRLVTALTETRGKLTKIAESYATRGTLEALANWHPEPTDNIYLYNTPHIANQSLMDPEVRLIVNFRDPRDLACNQFHWALQHPMPGRSESETSAYRDRIRAGGIDKFVLDQNNIPLFRAFRAIQTRLHSGEEDVLIVSYSQLCLDFDGLVDRLVRFLGAESRDLPWERIEKERAGDLPGNQAWIGRMWTGADVSPGRHRRELRAETIRALDDKYEECLKFLRSLEQPSFRRFLATEKELPQMEMVLVGKSGQLFLTKDSNDLVSQLTGECVLPRGQIFKIAAVHAARCQFGALVGGFRYEHAIVPNKEVVLRDQLTDGVHFECRGPRPLKQFLDSAASAVWRPFYQPDALEQGPGAKFFSMTDTHWNHAGAYRYLRAFLDAKLPSVSAVLGRIALRSFMALQQGDLGLKLEMPPEPVEIVAPAVPAAKLIFTNGLQGEGAVRWYENGNPGLERRAFVLHDSCTLWLLEILPELFSETIFFHGTVFDFQFLELLAPSVVICLQLERFFVRTPDLGGSMIQFIEAKESEKKLERRFGEFWRARTVPDSVPLSGAARESGRGNCAP